ncbi:MAG: PolC-type DNA polymerase III [Kiritimatiellia bacterium]
MNRNLPRHIVWICSFLVIFSAVAADSNPVVPPAFRMPTSGTRMANITFVIFDTETTGFSPANDRVIEIGAVKVRNGKKLGEKTWLLNPQRYIPWYVQNVHHITSEMLKDKPLFADVYPEFLEFIDGAVLIAHNAPFDIRMMSAEAKRAGMPAPKNAVLDSLALFRNWYPELKSHTVGDLIDLFDISTEGMHAHRATDDSLFVYYAIQMEMERRSEEPRFSELLKGAGQTLHFTEK